MRRNCNLELHLFPCSNSQQHQNQQQQPLTIFYNGNMSVCHVTEPQAKAILMLANREKEEGKMRSRTATGSCSSSEPASPTTLTSPIYSPNNGLSMKRSLQRFLQKRNHRIQSTNPYNINRPSSGFTLHL